MQFGKKIAKPLTSLALGTLVTTWAAAAETETEGDKPEEKESKPEVMQVWGTKVQASSEPIDDDYLALKQADHISDLLRPIPGVDVGGAHSLNQRITIRSMDDKDIDITIDGARQNSYMYHHMGNLQIHADILKSASIEVGKSSVLVGGLGGGAYFETKTADELLAPDRNWGAFGKIGYGDNWGSSYSLSTYGRISESFDALAYYNHIDRIDYRVGGGKIKDQNGEKVSGSNGKVKGLEGSLDDYLVKLGWNVTENQRFELSREVYQDKGDYSYRPDMGLATGTVISETLQVPMTFPTKFDRETTVLKYTATLSDTLLTASVFQNNSVFWRDEAGLANWRPQLAIEKSGEATNTGARVLGETKLVLGLPQTLRYGGEYTEYKTSYKEVDAEKAAEKAHYAAFYAEDQIALTESFRLTPGLRQDQANLDAATTKDKFSQVSYGIKADYDIVKNWSVSASTTQLFKAPELGEVFVGAGMGEVENPDIKAQTGANSQLTLQYDQFSRGVGGFKAGVTYFNTQIDDYIYEYATLPGGNAGQTWKDNVGDLLIRGYEAHVRLDLHPFSLLLTHSVSKSELSAFSDYAELEGARIDREQGPTTSLALDYNMSSQPISLHYDVLNVAKLSAGKDLDVMTHDEGNGKEAFTVHNVSARWTPAVGAGLLDITVGVDNLLDEYYTSQSSRTGVSLHPLFQTLYLTDYEPGRCFKTTVGYKF
jgi:hemoglobin/transferrin/lactoferrin receptor protein